MDTPVLADQQKHQFFTDITKGKRSHKHFLKEPITFFIWLEGPIVNFLIGNHTS